MDPPAEPGWPPACAPPWKNPVHAPDSYNQLLWRRWDGACPLPDGRSSPCVAAYAGSIYLFGGLKGRRIMTNCYRYSSS